MRELRLPLLLGSVGLLLIAGGCANRPPARGAPRALQTRSWFNIFPKCQMIYRYPQAHYPDTQERLCWAIAEEQKE